MADYPRFEDLAERNPHLLDDPARYTEAATRATPQVAVDVSGWDPGPPFVDLAWQQTGFRNQDTRGTCYAFAACAGMEAAYRRIHGVSLDLSEQFAFHLNKAAELFPGYTNDPRPYENNSSLWGFQGSADIVAKLWRTAIPDENAAPYLGGNAMTTLLNAVPGTAFLTATPPAGPNQPAQAALDAFEFNNGHIPDASRNLARYRITVFDVLPGRPTVSMLERVLASGREVVADVPGHCLLLTGYDRIRQRFLAKNSWGENQFITIDYGSLTWPILSGWIIVDVTHPDSPPQWDPSWMGRWQMSHDGWRGELVIRRTTDYRTPLGTPTKLGTYIDAGGQRFDVNGTTVENGQGLHFWIAGTTTRVQPGSPTGQEFCAYLFDNDRTTAAGWTTWNGTPYGVVLSRAPLPPNTGDFAPHDWIGNWDVNQNGWPAHLRITSAQPFAAQYTAPDGVTPFVSGDHSAGAHTVHGSMPGLADFRIYAHTKDRDLFSGIFVSGGLRRGVTGRRSPAPPAAEPGTPLVPDVLGLDRASATDYLNGCGYSVAVEWEWSSAHEENTVTFQYPLAGTPLPPPAQVTLTIRTAPPEGWGTDHGPGGPDPILKILKPPG